MARAQGPRCPGAGPHRSRHLSRAPRSRQTRSGQSTYTKAKPSGAQLGTLIVFGGEPTSARFAEGSVGALLLTSDHEPFSYGKMGCESGKEDRRQSKRERDHDMAVRRQVLRDEVQELILERLMESRWEPGSRLSIDGLARDLEVSPTPVREAMVSLERSGLVEYVALRGYVVAPLLNAKQIDELLDARKVIETSVLGRAFADWEALLSDLEEAHARHGEVVERIKSSSQVDYALVREHFQADWGFHQVVFDHAGNRYLAQMVDSLRPHTHRMRQTWEGGPVGLDALQAYEEHAQILEKVRQHHHDGAIQALNDHLDAVRGRSHSAEDSQ